MATRPEKRTRFFSAKVEQDVDIAALNQLAISDLASGKCDEAERLLSEALTSYEGSTSLAKDRKTICSRPIHSGLTKKKRNENLITASGYEYDEGLHMFPDPLPLNPLGSRSSIIATLRYNLGQICKQRQDYQASREWFKMSLMILGSHDLPTRFKVLHNLGYTHYRCNETKESLQSYKKALILVSELEEERIALASTLNCVAVLHFHANGGAGNTSLVLLHESLRIFQNITDRDDRAKAILLNNIGRACFMRSEYKLAFEAYNKALKIRRSLECSESMDVAAVHYNLGQTLHKLSNRTNALNHYQHFLRVAETNIDSGTKEVAIVYKCIAEIYHEESDLQKSFEAYTKSLESIRAAGGAENIEVAAILNKIGNLAYEMNRFEAALSFYNEGLEIESKHLDPNHPHLIITRTNIAHVYKQSGANAKALAMYCNVYASQLPTYGENSLEVASTLTSMGLVQYHLGHLDDAFESYQESLRIRRNLPPEEKRNNAADIASTMNSLGLVTFKQGMYKVSQEFFFHALRLRQEILGPDHHDVAILWYNLGTIYFEQGEDDEAVKFFKEALRVERISLGNHHKDTLMTLQHVSQVLQQVGRLEEAASMCSEALEIASSRQKRDFASEAKLYNHLGNIYLQTGDVERMMDAYTQASRYYRKCGKSETDVIIAGYNYYGLAKLHPPSACTA